MKTSDLTAERERVSKVAGMGCFVQGLGLIAPFALYAVFGALGAVVGMVILAALFLVGSSLSMSWRCGNCKNPVASNSVMLCPVCGAKLHASRRGSLSYGARGALFAVFVVGLLYFLPRGCSSSVERVSEKVEITPNMKMTKKLDYDQPVITDKHAPVCNQSLLLAAALDRRADGGLSPIYDAFGAILNRSEKIRKLGCEEWREDIPVFFVHRMKPPLDDFVGFGTSPNGIAEYFTMEPYLRNKVESGAAAQFPLADGQQAQSSTMAKGEGGALYSDVGPDKVRQPEPAAEGAKIHESYEWEKPALLRGTVRSGIFANCCTEGKEVMQPYDYLQLNIPITVNGYSNEEPTMVSVGVVQLSAAGGSAFKTFTEGKRVVVSCKALRFGATGHYALPAYCVDASLSK